VKGRVYKRGKTWTYVFDGAPDLLTGERRQITKGGFTTDTEAWSECRKAMTAEETGTRVKAAKRTVEQLLEEWMTRRQHKLKPSMLANYRNYARYYVYPYIGQRVAQDLDSAVFDALYDKLLTSGRVKARANLERDAKRQEEAWRRERRIADKAAGKKLLGPAGKPLPLREAPPTGLSPKTVVNVHRMLHRAWTDAVTWRYVTRNVVAETSPPRVPRTRRQTWTVDELRRFLTVAKEDRFFALWVLEATTGMRRCELAGIRRDGVNQEASTLDVDDTRVVIDGAVIDSDGKTAGSWHTIAVDRYTLAALTAHLGRIEKERAEFGPDYQDHGKLFCWPNGTLPHPDTITSRFKKLAEKAGVPVIKLHEARHTYVTAGRRAKVDTKALSRRVGHATVGFTMETYMDGDTEADREVADTMASIILPGIVEMITGNTDGP
jgi:integrase